MTSKSLTSRSRSGRFSKNNHKNLFHDVSLKLLNSVCEKKWIRDLKEVSCFNINGVGVIDIGGKPVPKLSWSAFFELYMHLTITFNTTCLRSKRFRWVLEQKTRNESQMLREKWGELKSG